MCLPGLHRGPGPAVHLGDWQDHVDYSIMLFRDELFPLFFEIFAYIHFLTLLSVFPPFPRTHAEIAHCSEWRAPGSPGGAAEACGLSPELASSWVGRGGSGLEPRT